MKILVISNLYPPHEIGGYEIRCRDIVERLAALGHDIRILTSDHRVPGRADETPQPHVSRRLRVHGFFGHPWLPVHRLHSLEAHNHRVLRDEIARFTPDIIHVWNMGGISKSLLHRLENSPIPVVYDISDHWIARSIAGDVWLDWWNGAPSSAIHALTRTFARLTGLRALIDRLTPTFPASRLRFRRIYFCSAFMRDHTAAKGWPVSHASVIHCGIDTRAFTVKSGHAAFGKLLWVGRLSEDKDPLTAIRSLAAAHRAGLTHLTLDLFGKGDPDYTVLLEREIDALRLRDHVRIGVVPAHEMRALYSRYDALLFTSDWSEPFALTPLEAMASGLPVITSLDGGQAELARDGVNCLVAAAANPGLYAARLVEINASPALRETLAANALDEVRRRFDLDPITRQIEIFLQSSTEK